MWLGLILLFLQLQPIGIFEKSGDCLNVFSDSLFMLLFIATIYILPIRGFGCLSKTFFMCVADKLESAVILYLENMSWTILPKAKYLNKAVNIRNLVYNSNTQRDGNSLNKQQQKSSVRSSVTLYLLQEMLSLFSFVKNIDDDCKKPNHDLAH